MVEGVFAHTDADIAVSISGIAGPDGGSDEKPVGLVWFGWGKRGENVFTEHFVFGGDRQAVRKQAVAMALEKLLALLL
jgi:nicotinamide-nucleotide amidase